MVKVLLYFVDFETQASFLRKSGRLMSDEFDIFVFNAFWQNWRA